MQREQQTEMTLMKQFLTPLMVLTLTLAAVTATAQTQTQTQIQTQPTAPLKLSTVAGGLVNPWSLAFLPDGRMLVTEKPGRLRLVSADGSSTSTAIAGVPAVDARGQGGLFEVLPAADFGSTRRIYLSYAEAGTGEEAGRNGLAVGTGVLNSALDAITEWRVIYRQAPKVSSAGHFGGRLLLAPGGTLFVTQGDRQLGTERGKAQDLALGHGKVMRLKLDGGPAPGNPFAGKPGAQAGIWSYGHRNVQGAALHPVTGELWATEHGPQGGDELNRVLPGRNYGWPIISYGCEYGAPVGECPTVGGATAGAGLEQPVTYWVPRSIAPSGMIFYSGDRFPEWRGQVLLGALGGQAVWRVKLDAEGRFVERESLPVRVADRVRDVRQGPDGWVYLLTDSNPGRVLRIER
jgi:glucose/arabinose dehydrogenase